MYFASLGNLLDGILFLCIINPVIIMETNEGTRVIAFEENIYHVF